MKRVFTILMLCCFWSACEKREPLPDLVSAPEVFISWESDSGDVKLGVTDGGPFLTSDYFIDTNYFEGLFSFTFWLPDSSGRIEIAIGNYESPPSPDTLNNLLNTIIAGYKDYDMDFVLDPLEVSIIMENIYENQGVTTSSIVDNYGSRFNIIRVEQKDWFGQKYLEFEFEFEAKIGSGIYPVFELKNGKGVAAFQL